MSNIINRLNAFGSDDPLEMDRLCRDAVARIEALENALRVIIAEPDGCVSPGFKALAATALALPEQDK